MKLYESFLNPEKHIAFYPSWYPSAQLGKSEILNELDCLLSYGIRGIMLHPNNTDHLATFSNEWFERLKLVLHLLQKKDITVYLYEDQFSPQGFYSKQLSFKYPELNAFQIFMDPALSQCAGKNSDEEKKLEYLCSDHSFSVRSILQASRECKECYLDVFNPKLFTVLKSEFLDRYAKEIGSFFGNTLQGMVYKEHHLLGFNIYDSIRNEIAPLTWTLDFPEYFQVKNSYSILDHLPLLWKTDQLLAKKVRRDYHRAIFSLYHEQFSARLKTFFASHCLKVAGHLEYQDILKDQGMVQRDFIADQQNYDFAGLHQAVFHSSSLPEKLSSSANHMNGKVKTFSANYLLHYQGISITTMKHWVDRQFSNGINTFFFHGVSIFDFLQYQNWKHFSLFIQYLKRFSFLCQEGSYEATVGLFYPMDNILSLYKPNRWNEANRIVYDIKDLCDTLLQHQIEFDFFDSKALINATFENTKLVIGNQIFKVLIFSKCKHLTLSELKKIAEFAENGVSIIFTNSLPEQCLEADDLEKYEQLFENLMRSDRVYTFLDNTNNGETAKTPEIYKIMDVLDQASPPVLRLQDHDSEIRFHHRKQSDMDLFIISNLSHNHKHNALIFSCPEHLEIWSLENGSSQPLRYRYHEKKDRVMLHLYPHQTTVYVNYRKPRKSYSSTVVLQNGIYQLMKNQMIVDGLPSEFLLRGEWRITFLEKIVTDHLKPWEAMQMGHFQGIAEYEKIFSLPGEYLNFYLMLDLGSVRDCAEVIFNGRHIGAHMWDPYRFHLQHYARKKNNVLQIKVSHSLNPMVPRDKVSGLLGPVRLLPYKEI